MTGSAILSDCGLFRYTLERVTGKRGPAVNIVGVNPSTADADKNDATIRKDLGFATRYAWGRVIKTNLCAYRATDVRELARVRDPIGPDNDEHLSAMMLRCDLVVVAWGPPSKLPAGLRQRWKNFRDHAHAHGVPLFCIGTTREGHPRHTLMTPYATPITRWHGPL